MKKVLLMVAICIITSCSKKDLALFDSDISVAASEYSVAKSIILSKYMTTIHEVKSYRPDTIKLKETIYLELHRSVLKAFNPIFSSYNEYTIRNRIEGYKSEEEFYNELVNQDTNKIMENIKLGLKVNKLLYPTTEEKLEFLKE